ncbi:hypothetical protein GCM10028811_25070 [Uliginosibacterium sediminicola]
MKCGVKFSMDALYACFPEWVALSPVSHATPAKREAWLNQVAAMFAE